MLELRGVSKSFGAVQALYQVDCAVAPGEVLALVGDNGAGKSTLIKCIAGIHPIDEGEVLFDGKPVKITGPKDAAGLGIEVVYQDLALADNLDVVQNMFLGRELTSGPLRSPDETEMEKRASETLASLSVTTIRSVRQLVAVALGRPAAERRGRQGRHVELEGGHPRRADRRARRRPDPAGARPRQAPRRAGAGRRSSSPTTCTTSSRSPTRSRSCASARASSGCDRRSVTQTQVVEAITAGKLNHVPGQEVLAS